MVEDQCSSKTLLLGVNFMLNWSKTKKTNDSILWHESLRKACLLLVLVWWHGFSHVHEIPLKCCKETNEKLADKEDASSVPEISPGFDCLTGCFGCGNSWCRNAPMGDWKTEPTEKNKLIAWKDMPEVYVFSQKYFFSFVHFVDVEAKEELCGVGSMFAHAF